MLGCCLLSPFGFVACNFSSSLWFPPSLDHSFSRPASSRLMKTSYVFVKQLQVSNEDNNQVILRAFNEEPELSSQTNWTVSNFFLVEAYKSKGISLWLNQGSTIRKRWEAHTTSSLDQLHGMVIKGEKKFELLQAKQTSFLNAIALRKTVNGKEAEYDVEEDNIYHIGVLNMNARNIILTMKVNVSAKVYDTAKGKKMCSTANGLCRLSFVFPNTQYVILTATGKFLGVYEGGDQNSHAALDVTYRSTNVVAGQTETEPLMQVETNRLTYGTNAKDDEEEDSGASSSSSEELYDENLCCICYDEQRSSFFVPCGHCATCYDCAPSYLAAEYFCTHALIYQSTNFMRFTLECILQDFR